MKKFRSIMIVMISAFFIFSCSSSNKLVLRVEEHKVFNQPLSVPVDYSYIADVGNVGYKAELVAYDGKLYIGTMDGYVYRISPFTGSKKVVIFFKDQPIEASVALSKNYIFVGTDKGWLYKVNLNSGKVVARRRFAFPILGHLYVKRGYLYLTLEDDVVYCLRESDLSIVWKYTHGEPNMFDIRGFSGISFGRDGSLYIGFDDGSVDKISSNGDLIWEAQVGQGSMFIDVDSTPLINGNLIYVSSVRGYTEALDAKNGSLVWKRKISSYSNMQVNIFGLFLAGENGNVYCLDNTGGETIWKSKLSEGNIYSLKLVGDILFVMTDEGELIAVDPLTGKILDIKDIGGDFSSYMTVCCNRLFVVSREGYVYSIFSER